MIENLAYRVLDLEAKGRNGHDPFEYFDKWPIPESERATVLREAIICAVVLWKIRQLEILEGVPTRQSTIPKIDFDELSALYQEDCCPGMGYSGSSEINYLPLSDAYLALKEIK